MKKNDEPIVVEEIYNKPPAAVWDAITDIEQMRKWYFKAIPKFEAKAGFSTQFNVDSGTGIFLHQWKVTEVIALNKITNNWKYDGVPWSSFVTFELCEENGATRLRLTHRVEESFADTAEFSRESGIGGWTYFIKDSLKAYLEDGIEKGF